MQIWANVNLEHPYYNVLNPSLGYVRKISWYILFPPPLDDNSIESKKNVTGPSEFLNLSFTPGTWITYILVSPRDQVKAYNFRESRYWTSSTIDASAGPKKCVSPKNGKKHFFFAWNLHFFYELIPLKLSCLASLGL